MLIDRSHLPWLLYSALALALATVSYLAYSWLSVGGPRGGSPMGLIYASIGSALMLFAGLLGARKKLMLWRVGRTTTWMRGHLWLGTLSFPFILFHSAFRLGAGSLTRVLMVLFIVVAVSGLFGAALQHFLPRLLTQRVPMETIYEQIDHVRLQLLDESVNLVADLLSSLEGDLRQIGEKERAIAASAGTRGGLTYASGLGASDRASKVIDDFLRSELRPFMQENGRGCALSDPAQASGIFAQLRIMVPQNLWPKVEDLENICEEKRQLDLQRRMHKILHNWLLVHIPASYALLVLGAIHAVLALRY